MTGVWLVASAALGRPVTAAEPYPHVCGSIAYGRPGGPEVRLWSRDCSACGAERNRHQADLSAGRKAEPGRPWITGPNIGPCAGCREPCIRYGPAGSPLCLDCREVRK